MSKHCADLCNVTEGDSVTIETSSGRTFDQVECVTLDRWSPGEQNAESTGILTWEFDTHPNSEKVLRTSIIEGTSSLDSVELPVHKTATLNGEPVGYFDSVEIHGQPIE